MSRPTPCLHMGHCYDITVQTSYPETCAGTGLQPVPASPDVLDGVSAALAALLDQMPRATCVNAAIYQCPGGELIVRTAVLLPLTTALTMDRSALLELLGTSPVHDPRLGADAATAEALGGAATAAELPGPIVRVAGDPDTALSAEQRRWVEDLVCEITEGRSHRSGHAPVWAGRTLLVRDLPPADAAALHARIDSELVEVWS